MSRRDVMRQAITEELKRDAGQSDREIGRLLGCSPGTVGKWRARLEESSQIATFASATGRGVRTRGLVVVVAKTQSTNASVVPYVYAIGPEGGGRTKIGLAYNVSARLRSIQLMSPVPLVLLWKTEGGQDMEHYLHQVFAAQRRYGEWFDLGPDPVARILNVIERMDRDGRG